MNYIAIQVIGMSHWFWFDVKYVMRKNGRFVGKNGWGLGGALTNIDIPEHNIISELHSNQLQYR